MRKLFIVFLMALALGMPSGAMAHSHFIETPNHDQYIANQQNHAPFAPGTGTSCGAGDPAGYGLETAHHGPDAGQPGKADGCYMTDDNVPPGQDLQNPVITN